MNAMLALMGMGPGEVILVMVVILVLFGAKRIPEFAKGLGQGIREFKKASTDVSSEFHNAMNEPPSQSARPAAQVQAPAPAPVSSAPAATVPKA